MKRRDNRDNTVPRSGHERFLTAIVALTIGAAGVALLFTVFQPRESGDMPEPATPDVLVVSCRAGGTTVAGPEVAVQSDGLHVSLEADFDQAVLTIFYGGRGRAAHGMGNAGRSDSFVVPIPPGHVTLECGEEEGEIPSEDGAPLTLTDPDGLWHEYRLACGDDIIEFSDHPFYYTELNPFPRAMVGTLPGLRSEDLIDYAGYATSEFGTPYRVVRDGEVVGRFDLSTYDERTFVMYGVFCRPSGIGVPGSSVAGTTLTPFRLPGYAECDPYEQSCHSIYVSARWYDEQVGGSVILVSRAPWSACNDETSDGCLPEPKDMVVRIVTEEREAARFEEAFGCGATQETACA